ncbi:MAG: DoxX family protein, partial [Patescibacteria group bacterium]
MHKFLSCNCADKCGAWSLSFLRVVTGLTFAIHGYQKISMGVDNFANMLLLLGVPAAPFMAWVVTLVELIGGILIILGITHWASKLLIIDMLVAIWLV